jgi:hypothetical protein
MTRRKRTGLILLVFVLVGFGIYDFWDGYRNGHSAFLGILSVLAGLLATLLSLPWESRDEEGPPVV